MTAVICRYKCKHKSKSDICQLEAIVLDEDYMTFGDDPPCSGAYK